MNIARQVLIERNLEDNKYHVDRKQVRHAGRLAWKGVFIALNGKFNLRPDKSKNFELTDYQHLFVESDLTQLQLSDIVRDMVRKVIIWDGIQLPVVVEEGLLYAD